MSITARIIEKRKELNLSIEDLALLTCMSTKQIRAIENDDFTPFPSDSLRKQCVIKIANILKIDTSEFPELLKDTILATSETLVYIPEEKPWSFKEIPNKTKFRFSLSKKHLIAIALIALSAGSIQHYILDLDFSSDDITLPEDSADSAAQIINQQNTAVDPANTKAMEDKKTAAADSTTACPDDNQATPIIIDNPIKPGGHIYFESQNIQNICISDADKKSETFKVFAGSKYIFDGKQPFTITADDFSKIAIYYQGRKVPEVGSVTTITLSGKPF